MNIKKILDRVNYLWLTEENVLNIIKNNKFSLEEVVEVEKDIYIDIFKDLKISNCSTGELEELLLKRVKDKVGEFRNLRPIDKVDFFNGQIVYHGTVCSNDKEEVVIKWITNKMIKEKLYFTYGSHNKFIHISIGNTFLSYDISNLNINKVIRKLRRKKEYQTPYTAIKYLNKCFHIYKVQSKN